MLHVMITQNCDSTLHLQVYYIEMSDDFLPGLPFLKSPVKKGSKLKGYLGLIKLEKTRAKPAGLRFLELRKRTKAVGPLWS